MELHNSRTDIKLVHAKPVDLDPKNYGKLGLLELLKLGYKLPENEEDIHKEALKAYDGVDREDRIDIFLAMTDGKAVGSITTVDWSEQEPIRGMQVWQLIEKFTPHISAQVCGLNRKAFEIIGRVTHPDFRRLGIGRELIRYAVKEMQPVFVAGQTKSPEAVATRANALLSDFTTFYGSFDVTVEAQRRALPSGCLEWFLGIRGIPYVQDGMYYYKGILGNYVPNVASFAPNIQEAFENIIDLQRAADTSDKIAVKPLISIRHELLGK